MGDESIEAPFLALDFCCFFRAPPSFIAKAYQRAPLIDFFFKKSLKEFLKEPGT
jgi:hypothetical protein